MTERDRDTSFDTYSLQEEVSKSKGKGKYSSDKGDEMSLEQIQKQISKDKSHQWKSWKSSERSCSSEGEDAEPELEAIPESPKSESSETEQFPTDLTCYSQTVEQACAKMVREPYSVKDSVIVNDLWEKVSEATLVSNSENLNMNVSEFKDQNIADMPHSSVSSDAENVSIIEKSSYETMEKNIVSETKSEAKDVFEEKHVDIEEKLKSTNKVLQRSFSETDPLLQNRCNVTIKTEASTSTKDEFQPHSSKNVMEISNFNKLPITALKRSESKDIARMKSLPFEGNRHQSVCRSKTDSNILNLPQSDDNKVSHSRYPHSKSSHSKKSLSSKSRKAEMLSSENLTVPIFRPPLERLLPIGMPEREQRLKRSDTLTHNEPEPYHLPLRIDHSLSRDTFTSRDLCEDKGVQTGNVDILFDIPAPERLLPVGPLPTKKDSYPVYSRPDSGLKKQDSLKTLPDSKPISPDPKGASISKESEPQKIVEPKPVEKENKQEPEAREIPVSKPEIVVPMPKTPEINESDDKKCLEQLDSFPFGSMGIECIANTIFDFTSDIAPSLPGIFEVCKTAMDIKKDDDGDQDKKEEEHNRNHRNSGSSADGFQNEKIELPTFTDNIQKGLEKGKYHAFKNYYLSKWKYFYCLNYFSLYMLKNYYLSKLKYYCLNYFLLFMFFKIKFKRDLLMCL